MLSKKLSVVKWIVIGVCLYGIVVGLTYEIRKKECLADTNYVCKAEVAAVFWPIYYPIRLGRSLARYDLDN